MAVPGGAPRQTATAAQNWYSRSTDDVVTALGVDPAVGLTAARAAELLAANGPNALPEEKPSSVRAAAAATA
jgi:P-type Ca2+ transporter type 2C